MGVTTKAAATSLTILNIKKSVINAVFANPVLIRLKRKVPSSNEIEQGGM
jgi:hypothetical protein